MGNKPVTATISVKVLPRASRDEILGWRDGELRLKVTAPPQDGRANAAVIALLATALDVRKSAVTIAAGHGAPHKRVGIEGLTRAEVERRLGGGAVAATGQERDAAI
ncbi:MAG TPA: DUF167 domain-containing protein [Gammaproteobacteria bacterium]|jgi:uncharacterized protein (TIGR00251 family)|nr:DUF167 domain-containing protein [Gammaproteobacteria bacterium]